MPHGTPPLARQLEHGRLNRFLATLPPHDFSLLAPLLRMIPLERGAMLHDVGEEIEHIYFPHSGMVSLVAVMQNGATVETATIGRAGVIMTIPETLGELRCLPLAGRDLRFGRRGRSLLPLAVLGMAVALIAAHVITVEIGFFGAAVILLLFRSLTLREAY